MPLSVSPLELADDDGDVRELRLALVCYGGVSLAIYMHGIAREIQSLVDASNAYEHDQETNRFDPETETAGAYWAALKEAHARDGVRTRVVVDIIAGTSAGGINGVVLAKALACDASQEALRDVWLEQGDIGVLLASRWARHVPTLPGKAAAAAIGTLLNGRQAPLSRRLLLTQIHAALQHMRPRGDDGRRAGDRWPIELHVTTTDFYGYPVSAPAWDPRSVLDLRHRHYLTFRSNLGQLAEPFDRALAFAARATSSFPGAFSPVRIADIEDQLGGAWEGLADFLVQFWQPYTVAGRDAREGLFVDGGVLDNAPFDLAIAGIRARPANVEVDRRLLFIQPDPHDPTVPADPGMPTVLQVVLGGLSRIPRAEPVLDELLDLREFNERVRRADAVIAGVDALEALRASQTPEDLDEANARANQDVERELGPAAVTYRRLKVYSVLDRLADFSAGIANLPPASDQAFLIRDVIVAWAERAGLLAATPEAWEEAQLPFLRTFDLGYRERRLRFVIRRLNGLYHKPAPGRAALNAVKHTLYVSLDELSRIGEDAAASRAAPSVQTLFSVDALAPYLGSTDDPADMAAGFLSDHGDELHALRDTLAGFLARHLEGFNVRCYRALVDGTEGWTPDARSRLLSAFVRFPVWDALLFPIRVFGDAGETDRVEVLRVSPLDVSLLGAPGVAAKPPPAKSKLKGVAAAHFGAFFGRDRRENDYLWGRLDAVERLVWLLAGDAPSVAYRSGFAAVLATRPETAP